MQPIQGCWELKVLCREWVVGCYYNNIIHCRPVSALQFSQWPAKLLWVRHAGNAVSAWQASALACSWALNHRCVWGAEALRLFPPLIMLLREAKAPFSVTTSAGRTHVIPKVRSPL